MIKKAIRWFDLHIRRRRELKAYRECWNVMVELQDLGELMLASRYPATEIEAKILEGRRRMDAAYLEIPDELKELVAPGYQPTPLA